MKEVCSTKFQLKVDQEYLQLKHLRSVYLNAIFQSYLISLLGVQKTDMDSKTMPGT